MEREQQKERPEDALTTSGSPAQERARRAEHEDEEREEKERARGRFVDSDDVEQPSS